LLCGMYHFQVHSCHDPIWPAPLPPSDPCPHCPSQWWAKISHSGRVVLLRWLIINKWLALCIVIIILYTYLIMHHYWVWGIEQQVSYLGTLQKALHHAITGDFCNRPWWLAKLGR
jgi:hypothetical protein